MPADKAALIIAEGLRKNKGRITFPPLLAFSAWIVSCLPAGVAEFILTKLPKKDQINQSGAPTGKYGANPCNRQAPA